MRDIPYRWRDGLRLHGLSLARHFMLASLLILVAGMASIGWWIGRQIEDGVVHQTAATTALYVDSFLATQFQALSAPPTLSSDQVGMLHALLEDTSLGQQVVALKVWGRGGLLLYSSVVPADIGKTLPVSAGLRRAWQGEVTAAISSLQEAENTAEREQWARLLEVYSPVRRAGSGDVLVVAEFYQSIDALEDEVQAAQVRSWLLVAVVTLAMYLLLAGFVRRASATIETQQTALRGQVTRLEQLLAENQLLQQHVRWAAARTTALNERLLRRVSAELHDGLAQEISLALLRLDRVAPDGSATPGSTAAGDLEIIRGALQESLREVRSISAGLGLPRLDHMSLPELLTHVVRGHERRTGSSVELQLDDVLEPASPAVKTMLYRLVQEALTNAYRHAGGAGQAVRLAYEGGLVAVEIADAGPGFELVSLDESDEHLGLIGMRERVASLGGEFHIESTLRVGTRIVARVALSPNGEAYV